MIGSPLLSFFSYSAYLFTKQSSVHAVRLPQENTPERLRPFQCGKKRSAELYPFDVDASMSGALRVHPTGGANLLSRGRKLAGHARSMLAREAAMGRERAV